MVKMLNVHTFSTSIDQLILVKFFFFIVLGGVAIYYMFEKMWRYLSDQIFYYYLYRGLFFFL